MGKALVIKDIDFSQEGLGRVTFINEDSGNTGGGATVVYSINGASSITGASTYILQPTPTETITWSISNTTVATLSSTTGTSVVVTPVANTGTNSIVLTATVGTKTLTKNITIIGESSSDDTVVITKTSDVVANESLKYYFSSASTPYKRRAFIYLDIDNCSEWDITIQPKADSPYKYGIQYHASRYISNTNPETVTLGNGGYVAYDSGWILPGESKTCDETNNKSNTVGGANYTGKPTVIAITATHTSDESVIIDKESYLANIDFTLTKTKANSGVPGDDDLVG